MGRGRGPTDLESVSQWQVVNCGKGGRESARLVSGGHIPKTSKRDARSENVDIDRGSDSNPALLMYQLIDIYWLVTGLYELAWTP